MPANCDRVWIAWSIWVSASLLAAVLGTSLTWDGAYYLAATLELGRPFVDHHRYANVLLLEPALFAFRNTGSVAVAVAVHGALCGATGIVAFAGVAILAGNEPKVRLWLLAGIVLSPLPGIIDATMEITPVMQTCFLLVATAWYLPNSKAFLAILAGSAWMILLHPISAPLLIFAACAVFLVRPVNWPCGVVLAVAGAGRAMAVLFAATPYERAQFNENLAKLELSHMLASSPWWLTLGAAAILWISIRRGRALGLVWFVSAIFAAWWMSDPVRWSGALNYRKFAVLFVLPFLIPAVLGKRKAGSIDGAVADRAILGFTVTACVAWIAGAISWHGLLQTFQHQIAQAPGPLVRQADGISCVKDTALAHWSATPLSLLLAGKNSDRVFVADGVRVTDRKLILFDGEAELRRKQQSNSAPSGVRPPPE